MKNLSFLLVIFFVFLGIKKSSATHIVGGEVNYEMLNDTTYIISLKVYRDCYYGVPLFDNPAYIKVFNGKNDSITFFSIIRPPWIKLEVELANPCLAVPPDVCVESIVYTKTIVLPKDPSGYQFVYQRCCRNGTIVNAIGHDGRDIISSGATFLAQTPKDLVRNSNPSYNDFPPIALCLGEKIQFDHAASDKDGDSLVYKLCIPLHGGDTLNSLSNIGFRPYQKPPFSELIYIPPFTLGNVLGGSDPLKIDAKTGFLSGTPQREGQFVVGVCVEEYRRGKLLGETKRDFQFNIVECDPKVQGDFEPGGVYCVEGQNFEVPFFNKSSTESTSFIWDFGDGSPASTDRNPVHIYADSGKYNITLISNPTSVCSDTIIKELYIKEKKIKAYFEQPSSDCYNPNPNVQFTDLSTDGNSIVERRWYFGDGDSSAVKNPIHTYKESGKYNVNLYVLSSNGCFDVFTRPIEVFVDSINASFEVSYDCNSANLLVGFTSTTETNFEVDSYYWDFDDNSTSTTTNTSVFHQYSETGKYNITMIIFFVNGCSDTVSQEINVFPTPLEVSFSFSDDCGNKSISFVNNSISEDSLTTWLWNFGDGNFSMEKNPTHTYENRNFYGSVTLTATTSGGCKASYSTIIRLKYLEVDFVYSSADPCFPKGKPIFFEVFGNSSSNIAELQWDFGDSTFASNQNTSKIYINPGKYKVKLYIKNHDECEQTIEKEIVIPDSVNLELDFTYKRTSCFKNTNAIEFLSDIKTQDSIKSIQWSFGDGEVEKDNFNPIHTYLGAGDYKVFLLVTTALGCSKVINKPLTVYVLSPIAMADSLVICIGDSVVLPLISEGDKIYKWMPKESLNDMTVANPWAKPQVTTLYKVQIANVVEVGDTCFQDDSILVKVIQGFSNDFTISSTKNPVNPDEVFQLSVVPDLYKYSWTPADLVSNPMISNPTSSIKSNTLFNLELTNLQGCKAVDSILIELIEIVEDSCSTKEIVVPNAFTPDGNGFNDVLYVRNVVGEEFLIIIYNRWGVKVFESSNPDVGWDGRYNGVLQSTDVFGYYIKVVCNGNVIEKKGNVTLVR